jgi:hypothetical protein
MDGFFNFDKISILGNPVPPADGLQPAEEIGAPGDAGADLLLALAAQFPPFGEKFFSKT